MNCFISTSTVGPAVGAITSGFNNKFAFCGVPSAVSLLFNKHCGNCKPAPPGDV